MKEPDKTPLALEERNTGLEASARFAPRVRHARATRALIHATGSPEAPERKKEH